MSGLQGLRALEAAWSARWPEALAAWSRFTKLKEPRFCLTAEDERAESLTSSFAMIRLADHAVVVSLRQVAGQGLSRFPVEILAHEVGHHVFCPADLSDQARLLARIRRGLPGKEHLAGFIANLYADLLINDRLQRGPGLRMGDVYRALAAGAGDKLWKLYMRTYEVLWALPKGSLLSVDISADMEGDAQLGARLVRNYAKDWMKGAGRFAALCFTYLVENDGQETRRILEGWLDTQAAGAGTDLPDGLAEVDDEELDGAIHPALDKELAGLDDEADGDGTPQPDSGQGRETVGGNRRRFREPTQYGEILKSLGVDLDESEVAIRYYRELAIPHLVRFPVRETSQSTDPLPEGLDVWDVGAPLEDIDWFESALASPSVIPGVTTVRRVTGTSPGTSPERTPIDLYLGIDCSGSMLNPRLQISYPVLAGVIMALSALRAGARVMATLSGEPGSYVTTGDFTGEEHAILGILTGYLGTGYAFGIHRLDDAYGADRKPRERKSHILVISDTDIFMMLDQKQERATLGWDIARNAFNRAGGGGTYVLHIPSKWRDQRTARMEKEGWAVHTIDGWEDLLEFAREFSRRQWERASSETAGGAA